MPQRSNDFQQLIRRIYEQLLSTTAKITESAMLKELDGSGTREVDILIEILTPGMDTPTRIAIECRDHGRASDVTWIDELIGKYRNLPISRVIAVSRKAFTSMADRKAQRNNIETRTLAEALATDWPEDLFELDFTNVVHWPVVTDVSIVSEPPWSDGETPTAVRLSGLPVEALGFAAWQRKCFAEAFDSAVQQQRNFGISEFAAPGTHKFEVFLSPLPVRVALFGAEGAQHVVLGLHLRGEVEVEHHILRNERYRFGKVGVTRARGSVHRGDVDVLAVQEQGGGVSVKVTTTKRR
ncbi:MAG TPA: restriction endonuclease [Thermoanaerobaculia bacterium]|jgi:hypothetical protein|nr:restriction endonuclease [Thermoanaerobaculia bacterium]